MKQILAVSSRFGSSLLLQKDAQEHLQSGIFGEGLHWTKDPQRRLGTVLQVVEQRLGSMTVLNPAATTSVLY